MYNLPVNNSYKIKIIDIYYDTLNIQFLIYFQNVIRVTLSYMLICYKFIGMPNVYSHSCFKNVYTQEIRS